MSSSGRPRDRELAARNEAKRWAAKGGGRDAIAEMILVAESLLAPGQRPATDDGWQARADTHLLALAGMPSAADYQPGERKRLWMVNRGNGLEPELFVHAGASFDALLRRDQDGSRTRLARDLLAEIVLGIPQSARSRRLRIPASAP